jgi:hypothetical protein
MFNIAFFDQWFYHIVGWPLILILLLTLMYLRVNWKITTLAVPATLACLSWVMFDLEKTLGRPYMAMPEGKFMYVHHIVIGEKIDLFVVDKDGSRLYTISNSKNAREQLNKSKQKAKAGIPQEGEFKKTEKKVKIKGGTTGERELVIYDLPIPTHLRK